jgi:exonuclease VII small subunit
MAPHTAFASPLETIIADAMTEDAFEIDPNFGPTEFQISASERAFEKFLAEVERLTGASVDGGGEPLLMSDDALNAFEEGITAANYALQIQAGA